MPASRNFKLIEGLPPLGMRASEFCSSLRRCVAGSLLCVLTGCAAAPGSSQVHGSSQAHSLHCTVTTPNGNQAPGVVTRPAPELHGNGRLWTVLPLDGKLLLTREKDGSIREKFPWWRGVRGRLTISGRRLDGPAGPLRADVPDGYGETGFQATAIFFPSEGCWEITGRVADAQLTFVLEVRVRNDTKAKPVEDIR